MDNWIEQSLGNLIVEEKKSTLQVQSASNFGDYPFFTSGDSVLVHNEYLVDGEKIFLATGGKANIKFYNGKAAYSTDTYVISSKKASTQYLYYFLQNQIEFLNSNLFTGSGLKHLQKNDLKRLRFKLPKSKSEQTRIAQILSTADRAIAQTEALIAKYQRIKTGLMQDLLTRGIDEHGRIRSKATHRFVVKNGIEVPEEWEVVELENITELITKGESPNWQGYKYQDEGVLFVTSENVRDGYIDIETNKKFIPDLFHNKLKRSQLKKGDILINLVGASIARSALFDIEAEANINQAVSSIRLKSRVNKYWFAEYLCFPINIQRLLGEQVETARANLSLGDLRKFFVAIPNEHEQNKIALKLQYMANIIVRHRLKLSKLQSLKTGLMQDLLSGRVRVKVKEEAAAC